MRVGGEEYYFRNDPAVTDLEKMYARDGVGAAGGSDPLRGWMHGRKREEEYRTADREQNNVNTQVGRGPLSWGGGGGLPTEGTDPRAGECAFQGVAGSKG